MLVHLLVRHICRYYITHTYNKQDADISCRLPTDAENTHFPINAIHTDQRAEFFIF